MNIIITEQQLRTIEEMAYPSSWNLDYFKSLRSFNDRLNYCKQNLTPIASGSGRYVFGIDNEKCLKLAKNKKGVAQNEAEYNAGSDRYAASVLAKVYDCDENFLWIEMQLCKKVTPNIFKQVMGYDFNFYLQCLNSIVGNGRQTPEIVDALSSEDVFAEFTNEMSDAIMNWDISFGDLKRLSSYGISNGEILLVDYGLNDEVYNNFYSRR